MADKTLATFRIDPQDWEAFKSLASTEGSNASTLLLEFVRWRLAGNQISHPDPTPDSTTHLDNLDDKIDERIAARLDTVIDKKLDELRSQIDSLRGKLKARLVR